MLADLISRIIARRVVRWGFIVLFNLVGFTSVVGIPVAVIIDVLLVLAALQGIFSAIRGSVPAITAAGTGVMRLFRIAAIGVGICLLGGVVCAVISALVTPSREKLAPAAMFRGGEVTGGGNTADPAPVSAGGRENRADLLVTGQVHDQAPPQPAPESSQDISSPAGVHDVIALIENRKFTGALALIDAGADVSGSVDGRTPLTVLELELRENYYGDSGAYVLLKQLIGKSEGLDRKVDDFGHILWHQVLYKLQNDPQRFAEILDIIVARGVDINQRDANGKPLADTSTWSNAARDIMIERGACGLIPSWQKPRQLVCSK